MSEQVSQCCGAAVKVTYEFVAFCHDLFVVHCTNCFQPCDVKPKEEVSGE